MDFDLSEEQEALRQGAAALLDGMCDTARVREIAKSADHLDTQLWKAMAEQGWLAIERSESAGGLGLGVVEVAVLSEELGGHLAPVPFHGTIATIAALDGALADGDSKPSTKLGTGDVSDWAERLSAGEAYGAVAWSRTDGALCATEEGDGTWRIGGRSDPVVFAPVADVIVIVAKVGEGTGGETGLFALATDPSGRPGAEPAMDETRSLAWLDLDGAAAVRIGGEEAARRLFDRALTALCAQMLGSAQRALDMAVQYAKDRVQFGRPIGSFQAVKHRCADMLVDVEGMRSSTYYAAWAVGAGDPDASAAASAAKLWCSDAARRVMASALQVHGGIGFTWEHDLHLYLKRSQLDQVSFGDAPYHRRRLVEILRPKAEAGLPVL